MKYIFICVRRVANPLTHTLPPSYLHTPQLEVYKGDIQRLHRKMERLTSRDGVSMASQGGGDADTRSMGEQCMEVLVTFITSSHFTHPHYTLYKLHPHMIPCTLTVHTLTCYTLSDTPSQDAHPHRYTPHIIPICTHVYTTSHTPIHL